MSGLYAILGAILGAGITYLTTVRQVKSQAHWAELSREDHLKGEIGLIYVDFVKGADLLFDAIREIATYNPPPTVSSEIYKDYLDKWNGLIGSYGTVSIIGHDEVVSCAKPLYQCLTNLCNKTDESIRGGKWVPSDGDYDQLFDKTDEEKKVLRATFILIARQNVNMTSVIKVT